MKGCSQGELGRCPAASPAFALLSKGTQEANQVHLVFTDSMSTYTDRIPVLSSPLLPQVPGSSFPQALPEAEKAALEKTSLILSGVCPFLVDREIKTFL